MKPQIDDEYTLNAQLGFFVGGYIIRTQLPIVNSYDFKIYEGLKKVVGELNEEDKQKLIELDKSSYVNGKIDSNRHIEYVKFLHLLDEKYIPKKVKVYWNPILITNENAFVGGLNEALWDSDISSYIVNDSSKVTQECLLMSIELTWER